MQLTKFSYYSDFVLYPIVGVAITGVNFTPSRWLSSTASWYSAGEWLCVVAAGIVLWTFFEYVLHRVALHRMSTFSPLHAAHHSAPLAFIGTPTWLSVSVWLGVLLLPLWACWNFNLASGLTVGVMFGYWWYGIVHHVIHHRAHRRSFVYFDDLRAWHMRHHHSPKHGNFGVTTALWDHLFGTAISARNKAVTSA